MGRTMKKGLTLIEVLVTLILLAILVAVVFPVVVQQVDDAEPTKAANDLANIRTAVELFHLNVRPTFPGDIEDLATQIGTVDTDADEATAFTAPKDSVRWKGPYIDATVTTTVQTDTVIETGFGAGILNDIALFNTLNNDADDFATPTSTFPGEADFVALVVVGLSVTEFEAINDLLDGDGELDGAGAGQSQTSGKFRFVDPDGAGGNDTAYFLAVPYTNN